MAVVLKYGTGHPESNNKKIIDRKFASINPTRLCSEVIISNTDSIGSQFFLGKIPQNAIIHYPAYLFTQSIAGVTSLKIGSIADDDALGTFDITGSATHRPLVPLSAGVPTYIDVAWKVLGFSKAPETEIDIIATLGAAATATGSIDLQMLFAGY